MYLLKCLHDVMLCSLLKTIGFGESLIKIQNQFAVSYCCIFYFIS